MREKQSPKPERREHFVSHLSDEFFLALGEVTATFATLEQWLKLLAGLLISRDDQELGQIVTAQLPFRGLIDLVSSLALYRYGDGPRRREIEAILSAAGQVEQRRNQVTHSDWGPGRTPGKRIRVKQTARKGKGLFLALEDMSAADIRGIASDADVAGLAVAKMWALITHEPLLQRTGR